MKTMKRFSQGALNKLLILVIGFTIMIVYAYFDIKNRTAINNNLTSEYPLILKKDSINGKITNIYYRDPKLFRTSTNVLEATIDDTLKKRVNVSNEQTTGQNLYETVRVGVWVKKRVNSTTISVYEHNASDTTEFIFPLLNEKFHPIK